MIRLFLDDNSGLQEMEVLSAQWGEEAAQIPEPPRL